MKKILLTLLLPLCILNIYAQDEPCDEVLISTITNSCTPGITTTTASMTSATVTTAITGTSCTTDGSEDLFYKFIPIAGQTDYKLIATWSGTIDLVVNIYEAVGGDCMDLIPATGLTTTRNRAFEDQEPSICASLESGSARYSPLRIEGIDPSKVYYIRYSSQGNDGGTIETYIAPHNPEDWCATAQPLTNQGCNYGAQETNEPDNSNWTGSAHGGTSPYGGGESIQTCSGWGTIENMVWYTFDVTATTAQPITIEVNGVTCEGGGAGTPELQIGVFENNLSVPCSGSTTEGLADEQGLGCAAGTGTLTITLPSNLPVGQYYVVADGDQGASCIWNFKSDQTLPIELVSLDGEIQGKSNKIEWSAYEDNCSYYQVERANSESGYSNLTFKAIGEVIATGQDGLLAEYSFIDESPAPNSYYRLRQIDYDEQFSTTRVVHVRRDNKGLDITNIFPVPAKDFINIKTNSPTLSEGNYSITDITGKEIFTSNSISFIKGNNSYKMNINGLSSGVYFLTLKNNYETVTKRFTVN